MPLLLAWGVGAEPRFGATLASFDGAEGTTWHWRLTNDPVMGGLSTSSFSVELSRKVAVFNGTVAIVPSLKAPGFCTAATSDGFGITARFNDASPFSHLLLRVRSSTPAYKGWKVAFAANTLNPQFMSYKARFKLQPTRDWQTVAIPFRPNFSNDWSPFTGDCDTLDPTGQSHRCCDEAHEEVCVTAHNLRSISQVGVWAEGVAGDFHLEIERIGAGDAKSWSSLE